MERVKQWSLDVSVLVRRERHNHTCDSGHITRRQTKRNGTELLTLKLSILQPKDTRTDMARDKGQDGQ
jgi:hypothetical protein